MLPPMKTLAVAFAFSAFALSFATAAVTPGTYLGTSRTTVTYLDPNTLAPVSSEVFTRNAAVVIGAPKQRGVQSESNPFSISIFATPPGSSSTLGAVKAQSARVFITSAGTFLVQYWTLQNTTTGFTGQLANNYYSGGLARDKVIANLGGPGGIPRTFLMHDGQIGAGLQCTLTSTVTDTRMVLKIIGYAFVPGQAIIRFKSRIVATR
jgi:hypothetical protein